MLNRADIERRVPHAGAMCLLDTVTQWDATSIVGQAAAPARDHPLARDGGVPAVAAVEYAAQATAVHGSLLDDAAAPRAGMLAKLSDVELAPGFITGALDIRAELLSRVATGCMYSFSVHDAEICRARGRLLVAFAA
jgi:predicted hotdog family 3-hydroxylacyl-ACP dehydratase